MCERSRVNYSPVRLLLWWWCAVVKWAPGRRREHPIGGERSSDCCRFSQSQSVQRLSSCSSSSYLFMFYSFTLSSGNTDRLSLGAVSIFHKFLDRYNIWSVWKTQYIWFYGVHSRWRIWRTALLHTVISTASEGPTQMENAARNF